jgi:signal transduction histidine kinase
MLSFILLTLSLTKQFCVLPYREYTSTYLEINLASNFSIALIVSLMAIYLLISVNHFNARQLVKANKQLTKLNEELDRFVYSTSHDLRAPLLSVKGLLKLTENATPAEQVNYIGLMQKRLDNLDGFIKEITDYSRNSRLQIVQENVNVFELAEEIWESLRYGEAARGIEFKNELPQNLSVVNDGKRMKVVLSNLISNAVFYHDQRKDKKYIRLYHHLTNSSFSLHIEDNGQGIAPELQTKIFDMFFRGNESSQGSGLGLYIVQETMSKLSGNIQLQSTPKEGSTFSITLPIQG